MPIIYEAEMQSRLLDFVGCPNCANRINLNENNKMIGANIDCICGATIEIVGIKTQNERETKMCEKCNENTENNRQKLWIKAYLENLKYGYSLGDSRKRTNAALDCFDSIFKSDTSKENVNDK